MTLAEAKAKRTRLRDEMLRLGQPVREGRSLDPATQAKFDQLSKQWHALNDNIYQLETTVNELDALLADSGNSPDTAPRSRSTPARRTYPRDVAFRAWCRSAAKMPVTAGQRAAMGEHGVKESSREFSFRLGRAPRNVRAMSLTGAAGGFTVPEGFAYEIEKTLLSFGGVRQSADVMRTVGGETMPYPTVDDTGNTGERLGENTEVAYADPVFGSVPLGAFKWSSKGILVSRELLEDSGFDLSEIIGGMAGERIGRAQAAYFTNGTGIGEPEGIVTASTKGRDAANAESITIEDVIYLIHSVDPAYRAGTGKLSFMCNDMTLAALSLIKDNQGRPLLLENFHETGPAFSIRGYPVITNQAMAGVGADNKSLLFGDLSKYKIRDAGEVRVQRLDERWAEKDQVGFLVFLRSDGRLINPQAVKHLLHPSE